MTPEEVLSTTFSRIYGVQCKDRRGPLQVSREIDPLGLDSYIYLGWNVLQGVRRGLESVFHTIACEGRMFMCNRMFLSF